MIVQDVIHILEELAPLQYAEDFDNVGLLVGDTRTKVRGILVTLDTLEAVVDEAIDKDCNLIVSFHPIIFKGLKSITGRTYVERTVLKAIKHDVAIFAIHTALDNAFEGVNDIICNKMGLINKQILIPQDLTIKKLLTYVPVSRADAVKKALFAVGAGSIGNYDSCSFSYTGLGTYKGNERSNPVVGEQGRLEEAEEVAVSLTFPSHIESKVLKTLFESHPYEEVAYEVTTLNNVNQHIGIGMIGEMPETMKPVEFLESLKHLFKVPAIRYSGPVDGSVSSVAVLGGSGSFAIDAALAAGADAFVSADFKYHDFFKAENKILLADIGHYESEQFTKTFLTDYLSKKITNFAPALPASRVLVSKTNTNPVNYL